MGTLRSIGPTGQATRGGSCQVPQARQLVAGWVDASEYSINVTACQEAVTKKT